MLSTLKPASLKVISTLILIYLFFDSNSLSAQTAVLQQPKGSLQLIRIGNQKPRNIVFILTDDHRYDAMGFLKPQGSYAGALPQNY